jgi:hypothetical protein
MTKENGNPRKIEDRAYAEEKMQYMLAELGHTREQLSIFVHRFENLITFFMAGLAASLSAIGLLLTATQTLTNKLIPLGILGLGIWGFGVVIYARLCITRGLMVQKITEERRNQEYFLSRFGELRMYTDTYFSAYGGLQSWKKWQGMVFSRQTLFLFYMMAIFLSVVAFATSIAIIAIILALSSLPIWSMTTFHLSWYGITSLTAFSLTFLSCHLILTLQRRLSTRYAEWELKVFDDQNLEPQNDVASQQIVHPTGGTRRAKKRVR